MTNGTETRPRLSAEELERRAQDRRVPSLPGVGEFTTGEPPLRLKFLSEKLGIPIADLERRPPQAIRELIEANADRPGLRVLKVEPEKPNLPASSAELQDRINKAKAYVDKLYEIDGSYDYVKEYPAYPTGIFNRSRSGDGTQPRLLAHYIESHSYVFGKITWVSIGRGYEFMDVTFEDAYSWDYGEPLVWQDRSYGTNGNTSYSTSIRSYGGTETVDFYLADTLLLSDLKNQSLPQTFNHSKSGGACFPAHRYTVRHGAQLCDLIYQVWGDHWGGQYLRNLINAFGFTYDVYDPLFKEALSEADDFFFNGQAYHDCDLADVGVSTALPWGLYPHRYPYESKVCINRGSCGFPGSYIWLSQRDRLCRVLQAVHILNKYNNPDRSYPDPKGGTTTPRLVARDIEQNCWNGHGVNIYGKNPSYSSGVRTNAFLVLETLLGYKHGDATSRSYADSCADILIQVQWGSPPFTAYQGETADNGLLTRPPHHGGQLLCWKTGGSFIYSLPPQSFLDDVMDWLSMPKEEQGVVPTNLESTATYLQALRVYLYYKYGVAYPNSSKLP